MKKLLMLGVFLLVSCMSYHAPGRVEPDEINCKHPKGWEYICYNSAECLSYMRGYGAMMKERFMAQEHGWFVKGNPDVQTIYVNLFFDHKGFSIIGKHVGTRHNDRVWIETSTMVCDIMGEEIMPLDTLGGWAEWRIE